MSKIRTVEKLNQLELESNVPLSASWHQDFSHTSYIYIGNLPTDLNELDILVIFSQYGVPVDVKLLREKSTGASRGFAFLKYEDWKSTVLAVDNLNGVKILDKVIKVDHAVYKPAKENLNSDGVDESKKYDEMVKEELQNDFAAGEESDEEEVEDSKTLLLENDPDFADPMAQFVNKRKRSSKDRRSDKESSKRHRSSSDKSGHQHSHSDSHGSSHRHRHRHRHHREDSHEDRKRTDTKSSKEKRSSKEDKNDRGSHSSQISATKTNAN